MKIDKMEIWRQYKMRRPKGLLDMYALEFNSLIYITASSTAFCDTTALLIY